MEGNRNDGWGVYEAKVTFQVGVRFANHFNGLI